MESYLKKTQSIQKHFCSDVGQGTVVSKDFFICGIEIVGKSDVVCGVVVDGIHHYIDVKATSSSLVAKGSAVPEYCTKTSNTNSSEHLLQRTSQKKVVELEIIPQTMKSTKLNRQTQTLVCSTENKRLKEKVLAIGKQLAIDATYKSSLKESSTQTDKSTKIDIAASTDITGNKDVGQKIYKHKAVGCCRDNMKEVSMKNSKYDLLSDNYNSNKNISYIYQSQWVPIFSVVSPKNLPTIQDLQY